MAVVARTALLCCGIAVLVWAANAAAQAPYPRPTVPVSDANRLQSKSFHTPEEGFTALLDAIRENDEDALLQMLGTAGQRLIRSGDPVAARAARERLVEAYRRKAEILYPTSDRAVLQVGEDAWPLPLPLVRRRDAWRFDAAAGAQQIIDRRIGRNEINAIETLRAIADAQEEFARTAGRHGALRAYARRFFSSLGHRNGLYWPTTEAETESPLGPLFGAVSASGYVRRQPSEAPQPVHGYVFRILERQGSSAPGGATEYVVNSRMIGGFAVIASPVRYGSTGIKTFLVSHHGTIWERDLGPHTVREASAITAFNPEPGWTRIEE